MGKIGGLLLPIIIHVSNDHFLRMHTHILRKEKAKNAKTQFRLNAHLTFFSFVGFLLVLDAIHKRRPSLLSLISFNNDSSEFEGFQVLIS